MASGRALPLQAAELVFAAHKLLGAACQVDRAPAPVLGKTGGINQREGAGVWEGARREEGTGEDCGWQQVGRNRVHVQIPGVRSLKPAAQ